MSPPLEGLIVHLMGRHHLTRERATKKAEWIIRGQAERAKARKVKLSTAQRLLPLDGQPEEEPANRFEPDDPTVNF